MTSLTPPPGDAPEQPIFKTAEEAWMALCTELADGLGGETEIAKAVFYAGLSSALSIIFHYGMADLRAEVAREFNRGLH